YLLVLSPPHSPAGAGPGGSPSKKPPQITARAQGLTRKTPVTPSIPPANSLCRARLHPAGRRRAHAPCIRPVAANVSACRDFSDPSGGRFSEVLGHELLDGFGSSVLIVTHDLDGNGIALLDAHAHEGHQLAHIAALAVLLDGRGAGVALDDLDQQARVAGMDAAGILNGILEFLHRSFLLTFA